MLIITNKQIPVTFPSLPISLCQVVQYLYDPFFRSCTVVGDSWLRDRGSSLNDCHRPSCITDFISMTELLGRSEAIHQAVCSIYSILL